MLPGADRREIARNALAAGLEARLIEAGYGDEDVSNIARVVRESAGLD